MDDWSISEALMQQKSRLEEVRVVLPFFLQAITYSMGSELNRWSSNLRSFHLWKKLEPIPSVNEMAALQSGDAERQSQVSLNVQFYYAILETLVDLSNQKALKFYVKTHGTENEPVEIWRQRFRKQHDFAETLPGAERQAILNLFDKKRGAPIDRVEFLQSLRLRCRLIPALADNEARLFEFAADYCNPMLRYYLLLTAEGREARGSRTVFLRQDIIAMQAYIRVGAFEMARQTLEGIAGKPFEAIQKPNEQQQVIDFVFNTVYRGTARAFVVVSTDNTLNQQMLWDDDESVKSALHEELIGLVSGEKVRWMVTREQCEPEMKFTKDTI